MAKSKRNRTDPKNPGFRQEIVDKIRTTEIVTRAEQFVLGETDKNDLEITMTAQHVGLINILLSKTLPNLSSSAIDANVNTTKTLEDMTPEELDARLKELKNEQS